MSTKKKARKRLYKFEIQLRNRTVMPQETVYMELYSVLQVLYAQKKYGLAIALCNAAMENM